MAHFRRYNVACVLDEHCRLLLEKAATKRERFEAVLRDGLAAKANPSPSSVVAIEERLHGPFKRSLTDLQKVAVLHLQAVSNGANFSVPGSGKTTIALAYYQMLREQGVAEALLVIGPASCFAPWEHEYELCFGRKPTSLRLAGHPRALRRELLATSTQFELLLTTYQSAARDVVDLARTLSRRRFLLVLDESHYVKRPQGGVLAEAVLALGPHARRRLVLTGTPMPNGLSDLWSQVTFLWPDQLPLGDADSYLGEVRRKKPSVMTRQVQQQIAPLFFRITKHQLGLPRPRFRLLRCRMSPLQRRIYLGIAARFLLQVTEAPPDREALREWRRARATRLLQVAVNPALLRKACEEFRLPPLDLTGIPLREGLEHYANYEIPAKIALACGQAREIVRQQKKVLLWSTFVHNLRMLASELREFNPVVIFGGVPLAASDSIELSRETLIQRFLNDSSCQVLIANPAACGESISLHTACHDAIYVDRSFNCAHYLQSLDRIHRLGLPPDISTTYYLLVCQDSIDEIVHQRLKEKMRRMRDVTEGELPGALPGYWSDDLGDEEETDLALVEEHIRQVLRDRGHSQAS